MILLGVVYHYHECYCSLFLVLVADEEICLSVLIPVVNIYDNKAIPILLQLFHACLLLLL